jgi:arginine N-succinyltransferase
MSKPENLVIRAATMADAPACLELSHHVGTGMTSMPIDKNKWRERLERSTQDFATDNPKHDNDEYFMVLEDLNTGAIVGSGAIYAGIGVSVPFYNYKLNTIVSTSEKLDLTMTTRILHLVNDYNGATEIGSLFVLPEYRRDGIGKFLSRARMLLLGDFPERFDEKVFAELRGWTDTHGNSPFWEHLGHKFFNLSFRRADHISAVDGWQFISDLMPKHPVYLDLLPQAAQDVVGKPHDHGIGAVKILEREGFRFNGYIDIFDAGPCLEAQLSRIATIANSRLVKTQLASESALKSSPPLIISNSILKNYRMTRARGLAQDGVVELDQATLDRLQVKTGDIVRVVEE